MFYISTDENVHYGAAFDHALAYLKNGQVHSLHPEAERAAFPEDELRED